MLNRKIFMASFACAALALPSAAFAQATGNNNNATSGSEMTQTPKSQNGTGAATSGDMKGGADMKGMGDQPTSAGTKDNQSKDLRGHSETPTTGK